MDVSHTFVKPMDLHERRPASQLCHAPRAGHIDR
jgi:hypothetical protein